MKTRIDYHGVKNRVLMLKKQHRGSVVIFEGDTDARVFRNVFNTQNYRPIVAQSKQNAIRALMELEKMGHTGILAIVDTDYWLLEGTIPPSTNLFFTDTHDLETMILLSPALEKILAEYVPGDKFEHLELVGTEVRNALLEVGLPIGYLRWLNAREGLDICFDPLPLDRFLEKRKLLVDVGSMVRAFRSGNYRSMLPETELLQGIQELGGKGADPWHVCQGHDLVYMLEFVLPVALERILGRDIAESARRKARSDRLDSSLHLAYERSYFITTRLYLSLCDWEQRCAPFKVVN